MTTLGRICPRINALMNKYIICCGGFRDISTSPVFKKNKRPLFSNIKPEASSNAFDKEYELKPLPHSEELFKEEHDSFEYDENTDEWNFSEHVFDNQTDTITNKALLSQKNVFVIQPLVGDAPELTKSTTVDLQLSEAIALVETIPGWNVCGSMIVKTKSLTREDIFDQITNIRIADKIKEIASATTVFISVNQLKTIQRRYLIRATEIEDILDRYLLVLNIFKIRAKTRQAKLQVALAEIPYKRMMIRTDRSFTDNSGGGGFSHIGGCGEKPWELARRRFKSQEQKIKKNLEILQRYRTKIRASRKRHLVPTVAVVGYTNAGKTTLIKALSGSDRLVPENHLFATLDVTAHAVTAKDSNIKYVMIDTVGFLSNLPHLLIDAFKATMEDMLQADVIIHICDVSHPDRAHQRENVIKLLRSLDIPIKTLKNIIEVHNKTDLVSSRERERLGSTGCLQVSATSGTGLKQLQTKIDEQIIAITKSETQVYRIPAKGEHLQWLEENASVRHIIGDGDYHFRVEAIISDAMASSFKANFNNFEIINEE